MATSRDLKERSSNTQDSLESKITLNNYFAESGNLKGLKKQRLGDCDNGELEPNTNPENIDEDEDLELMNPASTLWMEKRDLIHKSLRVEPAKKSKEEKIKFTPVKSIVEYFKPKRLYTIEKLLEDKNNWEKEVKMNAVLEKRIRGDSMQSLEAQELAWASIVNSKEQEDIQNFIKTNSSTNEVEVTTYILLQENTRPIRKNIPKPKLENVSASIFRDEPNSAISLIVHFLPENAQMEIMDWLYETLLNSMENSHKAFNILKFILQKKNITWTRPLYTLKKDLNVKSCLEKFLKGFPNIDINLFEKKEQVNLSSENARISLPKNLCGVIDIIKRVLVVAHLSLLSCKDSISDNLLEEVFTILILLNMDRYLLLIQDYIGRLAVLTLRTLRGRLNWECRFESIINTLHKICSNSLRAKLRLLVSVNWMVSESSLVETFRSCLAVRFICENLEQGIIQARHRLDLIYECLEKTPYYRNENAPYHKNENTPYHKNENTRTNDAGNFKKTPSRENIENSSERDPQAYANLTIYMRILWFALCETSGIQKDPKSSYLISRFLWNLFLSIPDNTPDKLEKTKAKHELIFIRTWLRFHADKEGPDPACGYLDSI